MRIRRKPETIRAWGILGAKLKAEGALDYNEPARHISYLEAVMEVEPDLEKLLSILITGLSDKWHRPRLLDGGMVYFRHTFNQLRELNSRPNVQKVLFNDAPKIVQTGKKLKKFGEV